MKILSIETSCDETAVSILDINGKATSPKILLLGNALFSQVKIHEKYGGVFPNIAKREHAKNLPPLLLKALDQAGFEKRTGRNQFTKNQIKKVGKILEREYGVAQTLIDLLSNIEKPPIDIIAVTKGPGLEPALWVGINVAIALGVLWNIKVLPINHMEGHIFSVLYKKNEDIKFPVLSLLISGGHTELVYSKSLLSYKILGETRDDAVGEAFDKVARMISLPYPGGPQISRLAERKRKSGYKKSLWGFPRPMIHSKDLDFSFSGLKTAVLYAIKGKKLKKSQKEEIAFEFEEAVTDVLISKTRSALKMFPTRSLIVAGGVIANKHLQKSFNKLIREFNNLKLYVPEKELATDNSVMIGIAAFCKIKTSTKKNLWSKKIKAEGNLRL